jgi:hypothetical protein
MNDDLESLAASVNASRDFENPPLHLWDPALSGDISIRIDAQGGWHHDNARITRESLVRLFASILRRESDGNYYLVTPGEKWRIEVERHALMVTDIDVREGAAGSTLEATLNTGRRIVIDADHSLSLDPDAGGVAVLHLNHGLTALFTRAAWYRLIEMADTQSGAAVLRSGRYEFSIPLA